MLKKKIRIFKWSLPVWSLLALFIVGVAAAAFLTAITGNVSMSATGSLDIVFDAEACGVTAGMGQIDTCTLVDGVATIDASGLNNDSIVLFTVYVENFDVASGFLNLSIPDPASIDGVSEITTSYPAGCEIPTGFRGPLNMFIYLADLLPNQTVDTVTFQYGFSADAP